MTKREIDASGGHRLRVTLDRDTVCVAIVCQEKDGAWCRRGCDADCEESCYNPDEHGKPLDYCLTVEWVSADGNAAECYSGNDEIPLHDGMPIKISWNGDYYEWKVV